MVLWPLMLMVAVSTAALVGCAPGWAVLARAVTPQLGLRMRARWSSRVGGGICSGWRTWRAPLRRPVRSPAVPSGGGGHVLGDARARARRRHVVLRADAVTNADQRVQPRRAAARPAAHPGHGLAHLGDLSWHRGRPGRRRRASLALACLQQEAPQAP